jgi:chaperonin GroES
MELRMLKDRVAIRHIEEEHVSKTGLIIAGDAGDIPRGEVVAAGEGTDVEVGDTVLFSRYGGTEVEIGGERLLFLHTDELIAKST